MKLFLKILRLLGFAVFVVVIGLGIVIWSVLDDANNGPKFKPVLSESSDPKALKILFVGNSLTYENSMPAMLCEMIKTGTGQAPKIMQVVRPGWTLAGHWKDEVTQKILSAQGPWDFVVLQDSSNIPVNNPTLLTAAARLFRDYAKNYSTNAVLFMTWSDRHEPLLQKKYTTAYRTSAAELGLPVIPVGDAFWASKTQFPSIDLYAADGHHPGPAGTYLGACMFYKFFTGKTPAGLPASIDYKFADGKAYGMASLNPRDAKALQTIADSLVQADFRKSTQITSTKH